MKRTPLKRTGFKSRKKPTTTGGYSFKEIQIAKVKPNDFVKREGEDMEVVVSVFPGGVVVEGDIAYSLSKLMWSYKAKFFKKVRNKNTSTGPKAPSVAILDALFRKYVKLRDVHECRLWGYGGVVCSTHLDCSHIYSRTYKSVRWDGDNAITCCDNHHRAQHNRPLDNAEWLKELLGDEHLKILREKYLNPPKLTPGGTIKWKIELAAWLRAEIKKLEGGNGEPSGAVAWHV